MENLKGKNVLIAGATGGIGSKAAKLIAGSGAHVFITGRNADRLNRVAAECGIPHEHVFMMDLTDVNAVNTTVQKITEMGGRPGYCGECSRRRHYQAHGYLNNR